MVFPPGNLLHGKDVLVAYTTFQNERITSEKAPVGMLTFLLHALGLFCAQISKKESF